MTLAEGKSVDPLHLMTEASWRRTPGKGPQDFPTDPVETGRSAVGREEQATCPQTGVRDPAVETACLAVVEDDGAEGRCSPTPVGAFLAVEYRDLAEVCPEVVCQ